MSADHAEQRALLATRVGQAGSGAARYGAAMYFYTCGMMPVDMLEIYRRCIALDHEDPRDLARFEGVTPPASLGR